MQIVISIPSHISGGLITVTRRPGDKIIPKPGWDPTTDTSSVLLYRLLRALNANGFDLIKKRMADDEIHVGVDDKQQYLRSRHNRTEAPHIYVRDDESAVRSAVDDYNKFEPVHLRVTFNVYGTQNDCADRFADLAGVIREVQHGKFRRVEPGDAEAAETSAAGSEPGSAQAAHAGGATEASGGTRPNYAPGRGRRVVRPYRERAGKERDAVGERPAGVGSGKPSGDPKLRTHRPAGDARRSPQSRVGTLLEDPRPPANRLASKKKKG